MDSDRWPLVKNRFSEALSLPLVERRRFLRQLDDATRSEVEALLEAAEPTSGPLDVPFDLSLLGIDLPGGRAVDSSGARLPAGTRVGPYLVEERIGQGGMGDVYRARRADGLFDRVVALKMVRADTETVLARFAAERRIVGALEHPGIARLIAAGSEAEGPTAGRPWLALEYVDGVPLTDAVRDLGLRERVRLVAEVAEAVHHAHRRLVVHRDLKPSNVLVVEGEEGARSVKLLDFGIAKIVDPEADPGLTQLDGRSPRTRAYAAPEQVGGAPITTATDVYGLGLLLFEVLTATQPFPIDQGLHALETAILRDDPPRPSTASQPEAGGLAPKQLRGDLDAICLKALTKEPEARYASAEAFAADLHRYLAGEPIEARAPSAWYRARRFIGRHQVGVAATTLALLAIVAGTAATLWQARQAEAALERSEVALARSEAVSGFLAGLFEASDPYLADGDTLTSFELLGLGVEQAEALADQPEVQAQVLHTIGVVYERLDEHAQSEALLRRALALRRRALGPDHPDVATTMNQLAWLLKKAGEYDEAESLLREALAIRRMALAEPHPDIATNLNDIASLLEERGAYDAAEPFHREALRMRRRLAGGQPDRALAISLNNLGLLLYRQGDHAAAEPFLRRSLAMYHELFGERHVEVGTVATNLGKVLQARGDFATAESLFVRGLALDRAFLGEDHSAVATDLHLLAGLFRDKGEHGTADSLYREALARRSRLLGSEHPHTALSQYELGTLLTLRGEYSEAETLLLSSLSSNQAAYGAPHPYVDEVKSALAELYEAWGKPDEGAP